MRVAIDTGGTFTDCVYVQDGRLRVVKVLSTPREPAEALLRAVRAMGPAAGPEFRHGTTVGTNTLLERTGARVAFITTAGFEDTLVIGRQARPSLYDWFVSLPSPLVELRLGVRERTLHDGTVLRSPKQEDLRRLAARVRAGRAESIAVSLLFSFANPSNERAVGRTLEGLGLPVSLSHRILAEFREVERASTLAVNAYLMPKTGNYFTRLQSGLRRICPGARVRVMQSSGGIVSAGLAAREPVRTLLSGPAGGVVGACAVARRAGYSRIISFDMGGTSTDVSLADAAALGGLQTTTESEIAGLPVAVPMIRIHTVGAGGGSVAAFDGSGALHVGPESAGADPGPACYGRGERPTVTDANLLLGRLSPNFPLAGEMLLNERRARECLQKNKGPIRSVEAFAGGILQVAEANMEKALRVISVERGYDPRRFTLVAFGGAGPLHACELAHALRIPRVLVPGLPGALSALGILMSDVVRDYSKTVMLPPGRPDLERHFDDLERRGSREMKAAGLRATGARSLDVRYVGQGYELNVPWSPDFVPRFHRLHEQHYGYRDEQRPLEVVNVRVRMIAASRPIRFPRRRLQRGNGCDAIVERRRVIFRGRPLLSPVYERTRLKPGYCFPGPAIIVEYSATTFVPPHWAATVDAWGNLVIRARDLSGRVRRRSEEQPHLAG